MWVMKGCLKPKPSDLNCGATFPSVTAMPRNPGLTTYVADETSTIPAKTSTAMPINGAIPYAGAEAPPGLSDDSLLILQRVCHPPSALPGAAACRRPWRQDPPPAEWCRPTVPRFAIPGWWGFRAAPCRGG